MREKSEDPIDFTIRRSFSGIGGDFSVCGAERVY